MIRQISPAIEELLGEYWDIAFKEATDCIPTGNKANEVLHRLRKEIRAELVKPECNPMTNDEIHKAYEHAPYAVEPIEDFYLGARAAEAFHGIIAREAE